MRAGFHLTGQSGVFGATAAVGGLLGLDARRLTDALGLAASFASGTTEFSQIGGMSKRLHAGRAAEGGLTAAYLAADGVSGPSAGLDGRYGFCRIFTTAPRLELLTAEFDATYAWKMCGRVTVHMADGSTHQRTVRGQRGSMHQPVTHTELRRKLRGLSGHCIDLERPDAVLSGLPDAGDLTPLWEVLDTAG